jgi:hypothetical protein
MLVILSDRYGSNNKMLSDASLNDFASALKIEFDTAEVVGNGYRRELYLPDKINGLNYTIVINSLTCSTGVCRSEFTIRSEGNDFVRVIPHVNGNLTKGDNIITKKEGKLYISQ